MGLEVKIQDTFKKCFSTLLLWKQLRQIVGQTSLSLVTLTCGSWSEGHHDLNFPVQWFCLISWRLFDVRTLYFEITSQYDSMFDLKIIVCHLFHGPVILPYNLKTFWCLNIIIGIMSQYDLTFGLKINVGLCDLYFMVQWFCLISWKTIWCMNIILWDYESVWPDLWPQNKCRSLWPIFHGPVILLYNLKTIWYINIILWDYESVWPDIWPQNKCRSLGPIFHGPVIFPYILRLFDVGTWNFGIISQHDMTFDLEIKVGHCELYFMVKWFCLISWRLLILMYEHHTLGLWVSMTRHLT